MNLSDLKDNGNTSKIYSNNEARTVIDPKPLDGVGSAQAQGKDRIYTMTVQVYNQGADMEHDNPLVTMTGSKLE